MKRTKTSGGVNDGSPFYWYDLFFLLSQKMLEAKQLQQMRSKQVGIADGGTVPLHTFRMISLCVQPSKEARSSTRKRRKRRRISTHLSLHLPILQPQLSHSTRSTCIIVPVLFARADHTVHRAAADEKVEQVEADGNQDSFKQMKKELFVTPDEFKVLRRPSVWWLQCDQCVL